MSPKRANNECVRFCPRNRQLHRCGRIPTGSKRKTAVSRRRFFAVLRARMERSFDPERGDTEIQSDLRPAGSCRPRVISDRTTSFSWRRDALVADARRKRSEGRRVFRLLPAISRRASARRSKTRPRHSCEHLRASRPSIPARTSTAAPHPSPLDQISGRGQR